MLKYIVFFLNGDQLIYNARNIFPNIPDIEQCCLPDFDRKTLLISLLLIDVHKLLWLVLNSLLWWLSLVLCEETFVIAAMTEVEDQCHFAAEDLYLASGGTGRPSQTVARHVFPPCRTSVFTGICCFLWGEL